MVRSGMNLNDKFRKIRLQKFCSRALRRQFAFTLVEMVVAVGVSSIFILMLASLLSQTMVVSNNVQKQLYATAIAEAAIENAKNTPYAVLSSYVNAGTQTMNLYSDNNVANVPRLPPLQFDLLKVDTVFGAINPLSGQISDTGKWTLTNGNFFKGSVKETITDAKSLTAIESVKVDIDISYDVGGRESKKVSRSIFIFKND